MDISETDKVDCLQAGFYRDTGQGQMQKLKISHPCKNCVFFSQSVWLPISDSSAETLTRGFRRIEMPEGQVLFAQGNINQGVFCVSRGLIALRAHHEGGASTLMRLAYPGEIIGFRSFLGHGSHQTEARALLPSRVCVVAKHAASRIVQENPEVLERFNARCIAEIDRSHARIISAATTSNKQRLADLLLKLMDTYGERIGSTLRMQLPVSRGDLADLLGVQPETLSRLVGRLEKEGRFSFSGRTVQTVTPDLP